MKTNRYIILFWFQIACLVGYGQKQHMRFDRIGTGNGLSQSNVICAMQDSRGFMWFGTRDGLNKYDGYEFTIYKNDPRKTNSIGDNFIRAIMESKSGDIWIATRGGVSRYNHITEQFTRFKNDPRNNKSLSNDFVTSVLQDSRGNIWIGTEDGLNLFDSTNNSFIRYTHNARDKNSLSDSYIRYIFEDSQNNLWVCTFDGGINLFNRTAKNFIRLQHDEKDSRSISSNNVYTLFEDSRGRLWAGTDGGGLDWFTKDDWTFRHYKHDDLNPNSIGGNSVYAINEDNSHHLWIGTENGGLNILNPVTGEFSTYRNDLSDNTSLSNNSVYCIYKDPQANMWIGTFDGGINLVNPATKKFAHYKQILAINSLSNNNVLCIYEDSDKNIWIGTDGGGLNLFDPRTEKFTCFRHEKNNPGSMGGDFVLSVCEDSKGNIWAGTWGDGVSVYNKAKKTFTHFKNNPSDSNSLSNNNAWKIYEDKGKNIWIGTYGGGLELFNPTDNSFIHYEHDDEDPGSISGNDVQSIYEDKEGRLWVTTDGAGLNLFDKENETFTHFLHQENASSLSNNSAGSILEDKKGNLWIGTLEGLSCLDKTRGSFINYTIEDGLPSNAIFGLLEDDKGYIWISTDKGISKFDPRKKLFKNFTASDGLQSNEFKQQAFCKSHDGSLYFGGNNGFNHFFPDSIQEKSFDPPLVITHLQIFNKDVPIATDTIESPLKKSILESKNITLSYKQSVFTFEFASLNYTTPEKKQYAYMLEGFDDKWNDIGTKRSVTYTNLDPGKYTFKVKGLNNDGSWSNNITSLQLTITPPYWRTWWFKAIGVLLVTGLLFGFYRYRISVVTKQKEKLEIQVKDRTDEVVRRNEQLKKNMEELAVLKEDLEREKYYLDSLMDNLPDAIYFKDSESRFMRTSKYMVKTYMGDNPDADTHGLKGKSDFDIQDYAHAKEAYDDEQDIQRTGKPKIDFIEKETREDGTERWVVTTKLPLLNPQGKVVGTFGVSRDITKIKMLEKQQHDALLEKAVAQGKFEIASDVMHDIGNAIVGFGSYLTRIRRLQNEESTDNLKNLSVFFEKQKQALIASFGDAKADAVIKLLDSMAQAQKKNQEDIHKCINEQLEMVTHIQEILNIQRQYINGHETQERKPVNVRTIINDSIAMLIASTDKAGIQVSTDIAADLPLIKGDRTKLMQLMLNILKNSIEAIDKNATERNILVSARKCDDKLFIQVKDSGHGFDKNISDQAFKKGFTTKQSSSGLGLYNCRIIADSHEGKIEMLSDGSGKGSITNIRFKLG